MHVSIPLVPLLAAFAALTAPAVFADVYKWVDENGKTHYSDRAPKKAAKILPIEDRLSLYSPEPGVARALQAGAARNSVVPPTAPPTDRIADLERRLQAERQARQSASDADRGGA
jgi:hypothetical protein